MGITTSICLHQQRTGSNGSCILGLGHERCWNSQALNLLNMGMLPQGVCRTGVKCVTNTQCSRHHSTWMSYSRAEKQYGDTATSPYNRVWLSWYHKVCARRLGFLRKAQAVICTSVLIFWNITITVVKTDHIITITGGGINLPLIPSDY